jgi:hypothetical protein
MKAMFRNSKDTPAPEVDPQLGEMEKIIAQCMKGAFLLIESLCLDDEVTEQAKTGQPPDEIMTTAKVGQMGAKLDALGLDDGDKAIAGMMASAITDALGPRGLAMYSLLVKIKAKRGA